MDIEETSEGVYIPVLETNPEGFRNYPHKKYSLLYLKNKKVETDANALSCDFHMFLQNSKDKLKKMPLENLVFKRKFPKEINVFREAYDEKHKSKIKNISRSEYKEFVKSIKNIIRS